MENEKRLIDAYALMKEVDESKQDNPHADGRLRVNHHNEHNHFLRMIFNAPTVEAVEVVHGRWIEKIDMVSSCISGCEELFAECSVCHAAEISGSNYCPSCGAKMDGGAGNG